MIKHLFLFFFFTYSFILTAQVSEKFEDGDFTQNPLWTGDQTAFIINDDLKLQLSNEGMSDTSYLQTFNALFDSVSWEFDIKLAFSPSSNNFARVYLAADNEDLSSELNGYFLQFGESLNDDAIELFRQNGSELTSICRGANGNIASSFYARIKVIHRPNGDWLVYSDFNHTGSYNLECQGFDNTISTTVSFGFFCKYTSSNSTKFYFDDILIQHYEADTEAPQLNTWVVNGPNSLLLTFSEPLDDLTALNSQNYTVSQGLGHPFNIEFGSNSQQIQLQFSEDFSMNHEYQLSIQDLKDLNGNMMSDTSVVFRRIILQVHDVVINEIMADPSPVVQLPDLEYVEIYNRTQAHIDLSGWILEMGEAQRVFPAFVISPESYLILCKESSLSELFTYGNCIGFPSFSLTNSGQSLRLLNAEGIEIHVVEYSDEWYQDPEKDEGGWSLEQINPTDFCSGILNWRASEDLRGGSPGTQNSIFDASEIFPEIKEVKLVDNPLLEVAFNQEMDLEDILTKSNYSVNPGNMQVQQIMVKDSSHTIYLIFSDLFEVGIEYALVMNGEIANCNGQVVEVPIEIPFMLPKIAEPGDIVFNEIMADPEPTIGLPNFEYLELFNNSVAPIDMTGWTLALGSTLKDLDQIILAPQSYLILCDQDAEEVWSEFGQIYSFSSFSLVNAGSQLVLMDLAGGIIHEIEYDKDWFADEEKEEGGWSLEAIDPLAYCSEKNNWAASIDSRGGSPGTVNSVSGIANESEAISISKIEILSLTSIRVNFSNKMDSISLAKPDNYEIDQGLGNPLECIIEGPKYKSVKLILSDELIQGSVYQLEIKDELWQCNGWGSGGIKKLFALADTIEKGDIVFNEILFDPAIDDGEFIEFVNVSSKILQTADLSISRIKINQYDTTWYTSELAGALLFPGDYVAFASAPSQVLRVYDTKFPERIIAMTDLFSLPNTDGHLLLHYPSDSILIIDEFEYHEDMHHSLLTNTKGVSLEKINLYGSNDAENWHSAASSVNYGTPGYENSQYLEAQTTQKSFELYQEIFSPDNDGFEDVLQINYLMDEPGYMLNAVVYDSRGREVRKLAQNELLGIEGSIFWNGENEHHEKASLGIYILLFEYFDLEGNVKNEKLSVVLGGKL